ncbi:MULTISPECIES: acyltransferase [unclassified Paenibacillus]|uniref:acyltransferase n=1 Tax=unclassified Paenibacillus TaxID=185978 RepID=UPI000BA73B24|nr:acyltransferase [Paenibacillus sp. 7541]PAK50286.1 hypothetical protein CHH75_18200 [Paenibacillus sp. 7541]
MRKERIEEVTLLRAMAFMAITMQHCIAEYIYRPDIAQPDAVMLGMLFHFTRFGTPTFVFLSGLILFYNYAEKLNYLTYVRKRATDILVPFLTWTVIYWVSVSIISGHSFTAAGTWTTLVRQLVEPSYGYHLWFILMIFQFYLLLPLLLRLAKPVHSFIQREPEQAFRRTLMLVAGAAIVYGALTWFSYYRAGASAAAIGGFWEWLMVHRSKWFVFYFFYFLLGAVCAYGLDRFRRVAVSSLLASGLAFILLYIWAGYELLGISTTSMMLGASTYLRPTIFLLIVAQLMAVYGLAVIIDRHGGMMKRFMLFVGRHSFGGFLAHAFVLMLVSGVTRPMQLEGSHLIATLITFLIVAAGSIGIAKLASLLPFGSLLIGAQGRKKKSPGSNGKPPYRQEQTGAPL